MSSFNALFKDFKAQHAVSQATAAEKEKERRVREEKARAEALAREREEEKRRALQREKDKKVKEDRDRQEAALKKARQEQKDRERVAAERAEAEAAAAEREAKAARGSGSKRPGGGGAVRSLSKKAADPAVLGPTLSLEERRRQAIRAEIAAEEAAERKAAPAHLRKPPNGPSASSSRTASASNDRIAHLPGRRKKLSGKGGGRAASIAGLDPTALIRLDRGKRDQRTIEEIERDLHAKRRAADGEVPTSVGLVAAFAKKPQRVVSTPSSAVASTSAGATGSLKRASSSDPRDTSSKKTKLSSSSSAVASSGSANSHAKVGSSKLGHQGTARNGFAPRGKAALPGKRRVEPDDDEYDSEDDDSDAYSDGRTGQGDGVKSSLKDEIWRIMGRDRSAYVGYDDDSDSDMEAGADEISREDARAARLAREEDAREEARLAAHAEAKRKTKKGP